MDKKHTIGNVTAGLMIAFALLMDVIQGFLTLSIFLIPFSWFITIFSFTALWLWFVLAGVKYSGNAGGKRILIMIASIITELIPVINAIPAVTAGVIGTIGQTRLEDARRNSGGKVTPRTAEAMIRKMRMDQARRNREERARAERESMQASRHPANDNHPEAANDTAAAEDSRQAA